MRSIGWRRTLLLAAIAVAVLTGCGGDGERATAGATPAAGNPSEAQETEQPNADRGSSERRDERRDGGAAGSDAGEGEAEVGRPEETVISYMKAAATGDQQGCRLFTDEGLERFGKFAKDAATPLEACQRIFELSRQLGKGTIEVGGRDLKPHQVDELKLEVERKPGARTAIVSGPGGLARLELVDGRWRISSLEGTG